MAAPLSVRGRGAQFRTWDIDKDCGVFLHTYTLLPLMKALSASYDLAVF